MLIVPVIDIKAGRAVQAVGGMRERYRPVTTPLCQGCDPAGLLEAYLRLHPFPVIYLADLDAIMGQGSNRALIDALTTEFENATFWLDAGFKAATELLGREQDGRLRIVLGSECLPSIETYTALKAACQTDPILSLDFKSGSFLGPRALLHDPAVWPEALIVMALDRVGGGRGPLVNHVQQREWMPGHQLFAAGGVRGIADLERLEALGYSGALVASALLDQRIGSAELTVISGD